MLLKEALILGAIGIILGIIIGVIISFFEVRLLNIFMSKAGARESNIIINPNIKMYIVVPKIGGLFIIFIVYLITLISALLPMRKINKISPIEAIRETNKDKVKKIKTSKIIKKLFGVEGELAYKNIRKDKSRYKTIVISIVLSIVLFMTVNGELQGYYKINKNKDLKEVELSYINQTNSSDTINETIKILNEKGLIKNYTASELLGITKPTKAVVVMPKEKLTDSGKKRSHYEQGENILFDSCYVFSLSGTEFDKTLQEQGISEIKDNECIITNYVEERNEQYSKITNYEVGDNLKLVFTNKNLNNNVPIEVQEQLDAKMEEINKQINESLGTTEENYISTGKTENETDTKDVEYNFKIKGEINANIVDRTFVILPSTINVILNENTFRNLQNELQKNDEYSSMMNIYIDTDAPYEIEKEIEKINEENKQEVFSVENLYDNSVKQEYFKKTEETVGYSFVIFIALFSVVNIFNTIVSSIVLRKKEIAMLKSVGMSKKQVNKMFVLEGILYGLDAIIYGLLISLVILYILYITDNSLNSIYNPAIKITDFKIPYIAMLICGIVVYIVIFMAINKGKKNIKEDIIEEIRNEKI